jgi:hypothetical protein
MTQYPCYSVRMFVQFDEPRPVLIINSESVKPFVHAF